MTDTTSTDTTSTDTTSTPHDGEGGDRLTPEQLRELFLFESLDPGKLDWIAANGHVVHREAGTRIYSEGEPATCFFVLLEGTLTMARTVGGSELELVRSNQRGVYLGATTAFVQSETVPPYQGSANAITDVTLLEIDARAFGGKIRTWFPMAMHLMEGLLLGMRRSNERVAERERLLALGRLSAGLTHELNNPAAAAVRATASLRERVAKMRRKLAHLAGGRLSAESLRNLTDLQERAVEKLAKAPKLTPMQASDAEDELTDWLEDHGQDTGWELAPTLVASGITPDWLEENLIGALPGENLGDGVHWLAYSLETELLMNEIEDATDRISSLVDAAKQYSQMDRAPHQDIDVHDGLDSTLVMLSAKLKKFDIIVAKEYDRTLPSVPAYPGELNQVWTNLIDNAVHAIKAAQQAGGTKGGTLTVRTRRDEEHESVVVEICDTGVGIPDEVRGKIFEPFFTTKPTGEGTGLGLDISHRIVTQRHGGELSVTSEPGDTRFAVRLPLKEPAEI
ncbi:signal transduction histidine kinase [Friedmanniella endophytica]|uniref:histidine kinase n=1 Tax=Microlunatus kandeliicorticis TaxID=1759536 RepID=A0A7W3ISX1_9ACTN|nr:ATP-binding protein [Microlunatus kandeliicorticis]MBA8794575.1 signal transduction histidine kinase [Microlunatus kandeliicorticis]